MQILRTARLVSLLLLVFSPSGADSASAPVTWPQFRGRAGSGVSDDEHPPVHFGPASNLVWSTGLPSGHSSPCIWGGRIFLTGFTNDELQTICLDRRDGRVLWQRAVPPGKVERSGKLSNPASSTPVTDGERVFVYFGAFGLVCFDFDGREQWRQALPTPVTQHGASTSPILSRDCVVLACDQDVGSHLLAVSKRDGRPVWRVERPAFRRGFSTPLLWTDDGKEQVVLAGTLRVVACDALTGRECWSVRGLPNEMCATPVLGNGLLFVAGWTPGAGVPRLPTFQALLAEGDRNRDGKLSQQEAPSGPARQNFVYMDADKDGFISRQEWDSIAEIFARSENALLAIRPGGHGDVTDTGVAWKQKRGLPYVPSPLFYRDRVYLVKNGGLISCFNATNGVALYQEERLGALGDYYSSPVAAGGKIFAASQAGVMVVLAAGDTLQVLARNELKEPVLATPAMVENQLYVRTQGRICAFGRASVGRGE